MSHRTKKPERVTEIQHSRSMGFLPEATPCDKRNPFRSRKAVAEEKGDALHPFEKSLLCLAALSDSSWVDYPRLQWSWQLFLKMTKGELEKRSSSQKCIVLQGPKLTSQQPHGIRGLQLQGPKASGSWTAMLAHKHIHLTKDCFSPHPPKMIKTHNQSNPKQPWNRYMCGRNSIASISDHYQ